MGIWTRAPGLACLIQALVLGPFAAGCAATHQQLAQREIANGDALLKQLRYDEAERAFRRAMELDPSNSYPYRELARIYDDGRQPDRAFIMYRDLLARYPHNVDVVVGFLWFAADHPWWPMEDSETEILLDGLMVGESALKRWPRSPELLEAFGWFSYKAGETDRGLALLREAVTLQETPQRCYALSIVASQADQLTEARWAYRQARKLQEEAGRQEDIYLQGFRQLAESMLRAADGGESSRRDESDG